MDARDANAPGMLAIDELGARIVDLAGRLTAATCRWLLLVAEFDARDGCARAGVASTSQWLAYTCGIARRTAIEHVRVARSLAAQPRLAAEMGAGRLSYSQVRAISRIVEPGEQGLVENLIEAARHGTIGQLETLVQGLRTVDDVDNATGLEPKEYVRRSWAADSHWRLSARLDPERGAVVDAAVDVLARHEGLNAADALVRLAEIGLAALADVDAPRALRGDERAAVVISLDAARVPPTDTSADTPADTEQLDSGVETVAVPMSKPTLTPPRSAEPAPPRVRPYARIAGGPGLPDRVVQRLLCASRIRIAVHDARGHVLDVGRSQRLVTDRQYRALLLRQQGHCAHPGCPNTKNLDAHHILHWLHGGRTDIGNLVLLCERHHVGHHDGKFQIMTLEDGRLRFISSDGRDLGAPLRAPTSVNLARLEDEYPNLVPDAATTRWSGQRMDRRYAVSVLAQGSSV